MILKGVYAHADELPPHENLDSDAWVQSQADKLRSAIVDPSRFAKENAKLQSVLSSLSDAKVVDYGGSFALSYMALGCPRSIKEYHVVETPAICNAAKNLDILGLEKVRFHDRSSDIDFHYDVLYSRTALQYADDWKEELSFLLKGNPLKVCLAHTSCGDIPTYLTTQNWYGVSIPYWLINQNELFALMGQHGYGLTENEECEDIEWLFFDENGVMIFH